MTSDRLEAIRTSELSHRERIEWLLSVVAAADGLANAVGGPEQSQHLWVQTTDALDAYRHIRADEQ